MGAALQRSCAVPTPVAFAARRSADPSTRSSGQVRTGFVMSRTVIVWTQLALLPQSSVAVQVRAITFVGPQLLVIASVYRIVTALQVSRALATPVALVVVSAGQSSTRLPGQVMAGLSVSRTVMVCTQLVVLPQSSVAVQVRAITFAPAQLLVTESE